MIDFKIDKWNKILDFYKNKFTQGEEPEIDVILFLIGIQELGVVKKKFTRDEKVNLLHIATCAVLEDFGYYKFVHRDDENWPYYEMIKPLKLTNKEQKNFIKKAIINYFEKNNILQ